MYIYFETTSSDVRPRGLYGFSLAADCRDPWFETTILEVFGKSELESGAAVRTIPSLPEATVWTYPGVCREGRP